LRTSRTAERLDGPDPARERAFRVAMAASLVETTSASLTWTGLPVYVVVLSGNSGLFTWLFTAQTVAGLVANVFAGAISDRFPLRAIVVATSTVTCGALLAMYGALSPGRIWPFLLLSLFIQLCATLGANAIRVWFTFLAPPGQLAQWTARRGAGLTVAKLVGTAAGPLVYQVGGKNALLLNAVLTLGAAVLYIAAARRTPSPDQAAAVEPGDDPSGARFARQLSDGFRVVKQDPTLARLVGLQVCAGLLGLPLTAVALRLLAATGAESVHFSVFWAVGFAGAFGANMALSRGLLRGADPVAAIGASLLVAAGALALLAQVRPPMVFAVGFLLVVISRTTLSVLLFATIVPAVADTYRGRIVATTDLANDGAGLAALLVFALIDSSSLQDATTAYVVPVALVGAFLAWSLRRRARSAYPPAATA
jgi:MFS family permease